MSAFIVSRFVFAGLLAGLLFLDLFFFEMHWIFYLLPCLVFTGLVVIGSANMRLNFFVTAQTEVDPAGKKIALTFDDGPSSQFTPAILELLDRYQAKATFFCIGRKMEENKELVKEILERGHAIGNHSYSHSNFFSVLRKNKVVEEIRKTNKIILEISGKNCGIFRPPYGVTNPPIAQAIKEVGMKVVGWNIRSFDTSTKEYKKVVDRVLRKIKPGAIVLLHDDRPNTPKILEEILQYTRKNQYQYAKISELQQEEYAL